MLTALCGLGLAVASCGGTADDSQTVTPTITAEDSPDDSPDDSSAPEDSSAVTAPPLLQFTAPLVGGGEIDAAALADRTTVFWFWAPT